MFTTLCEDSETRNAPSQPARRSQSATLFCHFEFMAVTDPPPAVPYSRHHQLASVGIDGRECRCHCSSAYQCLAGANPVGCPTAPCRCPLIDFLRTGPPRPPSEIWGGRNVDHAHTSSGMCCEVRNKARPPSLAAPCPVSHFCTFGQHRHFVNTSMFETKLVGLPHEL